MRRDMSEVGDINTHILQREQRHEPKHEHDGTNNYSNSVQDSSNQEDNEIRGAYSINISRFLITFMK